MNHQCDSSFSTHIQPNEGSYFFGGPHWPLQTWINRQCDSNISSTPKFIQVKGSYFLGQLGFYRILVCFHGFDTDSYPFPIECCQMLTNSNDLLQNSHFWLGGSNERLANSNERQKMKLWRSKTKLFCETSFKIDMSGGHLTSEFQYVLTILKWTLQKYCACHEKVEPRHTKSCNCHARWSLQSNTSVTWNLLPFHGFSAGGFIHRHHKARNHCACHAKRIVSDPLQIPHACQRFCNPHELLRLPRILQRVEIPAPATRNTLWTSKNVPRPSIFNDFDFQIALARRRGANFAKLNFQKCSDTASF